MLSGKAYEDLESTIVIVIFCWLNDIIICQRFTTVAEFEEYTVKNGVFQNTLGALCSPRY